MEKSIKRQIYLFVLPVPSGGKRPFLCGFMSLLKRMRWFFLSFFFVSKQKLSLDLKSHGRFMVVVWHGKKGFSIKEFPENFVNKLITKFLLEGLRWNDIDILQLKYVRTSRNQINSTSRCGVCVTFSLSVKTKPSYEDSLIEFSQSQSLTSQHLHNDSFPFVSNWIKLIFHLRLRQFLTECEPLWNFPSTGNSIM